MSERLSVQTALNSILEAVSAIRGKHAPAIPAIDLSADLTDNAKCVELGLLSGVVIQAVMITDPTYLVHFRLSDSDAEDATTLTTAEVTLAHLGDSGAIPLDPAGTTYLYLFVTDRDGNGVDGGVNDRLEIMGFV